MSSVDNRIVNMQFNSKDFTRGATDSKKSLDDLEKTLQNTGKSQGLGQMGNEVSGLAKKFSLMQVAGVTAVATIANKAVNAGLRLAKSFTLDPIKQGFQEYQTNLKSIQTIMANTGAGIKPVQKALDNLNTYADKTIYSFSEMASAIGRFTAAGTKITPATNAIRGMANFAALTGASAEDLNRAMYQMSQALASGTIRLMDFRSLENANLGTKNMREALMATAHAMGGDYAANMDAAIKKHGNFRDSLSEGWLEADIFTKAMKVMGGEVDSETGKVTTYSAAQLEAMGYTKASAAELARLSKEALSSATVIKTFPQLLDVMKESLGSVWASAFSGLIGNINQAKKTFTAFGRFFQQSVDGLDLGLKGFLEVFNENGGRLNLFVGILNVLRVIKQTLSPIQKAFFDTFSPTGAAKGLADLTKNFRYFVASLAPAPETADKIRRIFAGLFSVLHIGFTVVKLIGTALGALFGVLFKGTQKSSGGILEFLANIGDMLVHLDKFLTSGGKMAEVFEKVGDAAGNMAAKGISIASNFIQGILQGFLGSDAVGQVKTAIVGLANNLVEWIKGALGIHSPAAELVPVGFNIVMGIIVGILKAAGALIQGIGKIVATIFTGIGDALSGMDPIALGQIINGILAGGFIFALTRLTGSFGGIFSDLRNHMQIIRKDVTETFKAMQSQLKASALKAIAIAIGILVASLIALQFLDPQKLLAGTAAIGTLLTMMVLAFSRLSKIGDVKSTVKGTVSASAQLTAMSGAMLLMAQAVAVLAAAVTLLGQQDPKKVLVGIGALALVMNILITNMGRVVKMGPAAAGAAGVMLSMATSVAILTGALLAMALIPFKSLIKGVAIIAITLGVLVGAMLLLSNFAGEAAVSAAALIALAIAINLISAAIILLSGFSWETILSGLAKLGLILVGLAVASLLAPALATLGVALIVLGAAFFLAGTGMFLFATGFALLAATGAAGTAILIASFEAFLALLPTMAIQLASAFVSFLEALAAAAPRVRKAIGTLIKEMLGIVLDAIPQIQKVFEALLAAAIRTVRNTVPRWIEAGLHIVKKFLQAIEDNVGDFIESGKNIIIKIIEGLGQAANDIVNAMFQALLDFVNALDRAIVAYIPELRSAGLRIAGHILDGMTGGLASKAGGALKKGLGKVGGAIGGVLGKISGSRVSINNQKDEASAKFSKVKKAPATFNDFIKSNLSGVQQGQVGNINKLLTQFANQGSVQFATMVGGRFVNTIKESITSQSDADYTKFYSELTQKEADKAAAAADKAEKNKKLTKKQKAALRRKANQTQRQADRESALADARQEAADKKAAELENAQAIEAALSNEDYAAAGNILKDNAEEKAKEAAKILAKSRAEFAKAAKLRGKARADMLKRARDDAAAAARLSAQAADLESDAMEQFNLDFAARLDALKKFDEDREWQAKFEAASSDEQVKMLEERAKLEDEAAAKAREAFETARNAAIEAAKTDSDLADRYLTEAEKASKEAADAADAAKRDRDQIKQINGQTTPSGMASAFQPSRSVLENANRAVDSYTASMLAASAAAGATPGSPQFVQNNYSPEALSPSEIYRQSRNLIAAAQVKMGG